MKSLVFVGRIQIMIRQIDRIIMACNETKTSLMIIGDGPDLAYCQSIAGETVTFLGRCDSQMIVDRLQRSHGLINIACESFGLGTLEALFLGTPVL
jgi:glycosyltransferase involved in cell wall biosynthesis